MYKTPRLWLMSILLLFLIKHSTEESVGFMKTRSESGNSNGLGQSIAPQTQSPDYKFPKDKDWWGRRRMIVGDVGSLEKRQYPSDKDWWGRRRMIVGDVGSLQKRQYPSDKDWWGRRRVIVGDVGSLEKKQYPPDRWGRRRSEEEKREEVKG